MDQMANIENSLQVEIHDNQQNHETSMNESPESSNGKAPRKADWIFSEEQIVEIFNRRYQPDNFTYENELLYRQKTGMFMLYINRRLMLSEYILNTAVIYMHRFYMYNSFQVFSYKLMGPVCLFLAAKFDDKLLEVEQMIVESQTYFKQYLHLEKNKTTINRIANDFLLYEEALLVCLNFDFQITLPQFHIIKVCNIIKLEDKLMKIINQFATCCLILTKFSLKYTAKTIASICIHLFIEWGNWKIPLSSEQNLWHFYMDTSLNEQLLDKLAVDFLEILHNTDTQFKKQFPFLNRSVSPSNTENAVKTD
ncbi:cyclin-T1-like [Octopus bimaculoides]|uniref:Cyclin-like domain-containing protein n=1 Tax=Octopus bimaculoides TaxID=37653 RepID=A0A0L8IFR4_OCTBM|nr:cyclin-T1-like [Octopus bimaculoides]